MADLENVTNMVVTALEEYSEFENVHMETPGIILVSNEGQHFEIKIEEF